MPRKVNSTVTLAAVGDIMLCRKEYKTSLIKAASIIKRADFAFFNSDTPYAEKGSPVVMPHSSPHDPRKMEAIGAAGFNVACMANNHTLDWGVDAVVECRERFEAMGIAVCGAGRNIDEARKPAIVEKNGVRIAFLGYNSAGPIAYMAEPEKAGAATVRVHTLYESDDYEPGAMPRISTFPYREDMIAMVDDVKKAKQQADIVVVAYHWGFPNVPVVIPDYEHDIAHATIDAGADLIIGSHPHILKGIEFYKGKAIFHSLGIFSMEPGIAVREGELRSITPKSWHALMRRNYGAVTQDRRKSAILNCVLSKKGVEKLSYIPVMLDEERTQPEPLLRKDPRTEEICRFITEATTGAGFSTTFTWEGNEVVITQ